MSDKQAVLILVHGAWHTPEAWNKVSTLLESQGYTCVKPALPSCNGDNKVSFVDDVNAVRDAITAVTTTGRDVILIGHSHGGQVSSSAIKGLAKPKESSSPPTSGHVIGFILLASGFTTTGMTLLASMGGVPPPIWSLNASTGFVDLVAEPRELFYHDLPVAEGEYWVSRLAPQSMRAFTEGGEVTYAGWKDVPTWYVMTKDDKALPFHFQEILAGMGKSGG